MKLGIGLAAALTAAFMATTTFAADAKVDKAAAAALAKGREIGMKEAPAVVAAKGLACTVTDASFMGESVGKDAAGKKTSSKVYEVTCQDGPGYLLGNPDPAPLDCLKLATVAQRDTTAGRKVSVPLCKLPGNADPKQGLVKTAKSAGVACTLDKARWVGESASSKIDQYEVGCADGQSYLLVVPQAGSTAKLAADSCFKVMSRDAGSGSCEFYNKDASIGSIKALAAKAGRACTVADARYVASKTSGGDFYEVSCSGGVSGFMVETDATGGFTRAIECARAEPIAGGCTMTVVDSGQTQDVGIYNKKAKEIGYSCNVNKYRSLGVDGANEVVEVACSDHPDGSFLLIPVNAGKGEAYNCIRAEARDQSCKLSDKKVMFDNLAEQLTRKGKTCKVANTRGIGQNTNGEDLIEVGCTGGPGLVAIYAKGLNLVSAVMTCDEGKKIGAVCKLTPAG